MYWINFLHIYQPSDQQPDILDRIVNESYRPLIKIWLNNSRSKITLNINACLTEMLVEKGYQDVVVGLKKLAKLKRIEFTASAKYHPFLPILPEAEIKRQIRLNEETNKKYFGNDYSPKGFFPPEMGYSDKVAKLVAKLGYQWLIMDEIGLNGEVDRIKNDRLFFLKSQGKKLYIFFRERKVSNYLSSAVSTEDSFKESLQDRLGTKDYLLTAMDGETFGHHRPGLEMVLDKLLADTDYQLLTLSEIFAHFSREGQVNPLASTWASTEEELKKGIPYYLYFNPHNKLHRMQKKLISLAIKATLMCRSEKIHRLLDAALSCNHMWWSNPDSWWSVEELEKGSFALTNTIMQAKKIVNNKELSVIEEEANSLYRNILWLSFSWQRTGLIRKLHMKKESFKMIPFAQRAAPGQYEALREILRREQQKAVERKEYEQAIRFRDALIRLEKGLDVYYWVHIIDELRSEGKLGDYERLTEKYK